MQLAAPRKRCLAKLAWLIGFAITRWLVGHRSIGNAIPRLTSDNLDLAKSVRKRRFTERTNALLLTIRNGMESLEMSARIMRNAMEADSYTLNLTAKTDSQTVDDLLALVRIAEAMGCFSIKIRYPNLLSMVLTAQAQERVESLELDSPKGEQVFVAMWFYPSISDAYVNGSVPAIERSGYRPMRIDAKDHINKVDDEIIAEIRRSRFLVADLSCPPKSVRGGVYFEAGFAMGLGLPVIWTTRSTSVENLHFDTRQYNHIVWETLIDLCKL